DLCHKIGALPLLRTRRQKAEGRKQRTMLVAAACLLPSAYWTMGLLDSEAGKRRMLSVEIPVIERYNEGRDPAFQIRMVRLGTTLVLRYCLKPGHNLYQLETRLVSSYPTVPPETWVLTPLKHCPHLLE